MPGPASHATDDTREVAGLGALGPVTFVARHPDPEQREALARRALTAGAATVVHAATQAEAAAHADKVYGRPADRLTLLAVTGTNGKTTVASLTRQILQRSGRRTALLGTAGNDLADGRGRRPAPLTTPGAVALRRLMRGAADAGATHLVMEASSHALHQGRLEGLRFVGAAFTHLTQDHLDYHGTLEAYAAAKARLFHQLGDHGAAALHAGDPHGEPMTAHLPPDRVRRVAGVTHAGDRLRFTLDGLPLDTPDFRLLGGFNAGNLALSIALASTVLPATQAAAAAGGLSGVRGRMQRIDDPADAATPTVLIDYAHTPDALARVTEAARGFTPPPGRVLTVYGCGGDRDRTKRPLMTAAVLAYSDCAVLTADNPRTEDPRQIFEDASRGFEHEPRLTLVSDRADAIRRATLDAHPGDTVLITGKGHEDYQILGNRRVRFDDAEHAAAALRAR